MDGVANDMFGEENITGVWDPAHKLYRLLDEGGTEHGIMDSPVFRQKVKPIPKWWKRREVWSIILGFVAILLYIGEGLLAPQEWRLALLGFAFPLMMFAWALK